MYSSNLLYALGTIYCQMQTLLCSLRRRRHFCLILVNTQQRPLSTPVSLRICDICTKTTRLELLKTFYAFL
jgi:hypothetical protein